jgi:hypothetical protein
MGHTIFAKQGAFACAAFDQALFYQGAKWLDWLEHLRCLIGRSNEIE